MADKKFVLAGVMGWPVGHSRSPLLHNHWLKKYKLNGAYVLLPVQPGRLTDAVRGLGALGFAGCNVTLPHKVEAMALMDSVAPMARKIGAINTVVVQPEPAADKIQTAVDVSGRARERLLHLGRALLVQVLELGLPR